MGKEKSRIIRIFIILSLLFGWGAYTIYKINFQRHVIVVATSPEKTQSFQIKEIGRPLFPDHKIVFVFQKQESLILEMSSAQVKEEYFNVDWLSEKEALITISYPVDGFNDSYVVRFSKSNFQQEKYTSKMKEIRKIKRNSPVTQSNN